MTVVEATPTTFSVTPVSGALGARIEGLDLRRLDDATVAALRQVWLDHKVVFFPGADLDPDEHLAFARRFGEISEGHPVIPGIEGRPEVFEIDYFEGQHRYSYGDLATTGKGIDWHTDVTFVPRPPMGSILRAVVVPPAGGDTLFSNQVAAFAGLSAPLQDMLRNLTGVHTGMNQFQGVLDQIGAGSWGGEAYDALAPVEHPVVRTHPETGEEALFVNRGFTSHIKELSRPESDALLGFLYEHSVKPDYTLRWSWTEGDMAFWDNRATQHSVVGDFGDHRRVIQRVTLRGDEPR